MKKLAIVIPVYNEENIIEKVLNDWKNILNKKDFDLIIINDGSQDKTGFILKKIKKKNNHIKILNKLNSGHGDSIVLGYNYSIKKNYQFIFQVDSDDQFAASDFKKLWKIKNKDYDIILGCRKKRKDPIIRIILSKIILKIFFIVFFQKFISDANTPYRLIKNKFLRIFLKNCDRKYLAPNILMSLFAEKVVSINVKHFQRSTGIAAWSFKKIIYFGVKLIAELIYFRLIIISKQIRLNKKINKII